MTYTDNHDHYISILELEPSGNMLFNYYKIKQDWNNDNNRNNVKDYFINDNLVFVYNDHSNNLNSDKTIKYDQGSSHFNIVLSGHNNSQIKKTKISETGNDGFHLDTVKSKTNNNKLLLVSSDKNKFKLGLLKPKN